MMQKAEGMMPSAFLINLFCGIAFMLCNFFIVAGEGDEGGALRNLQFTLYRDDLIFRFQPVG